jgi:hypothetical protein
MQQARLTVNRYTEMDGSISHRSITCRVLGIVVEEGAASMVDDLGVAFSAINRN